VYVSTSRGQVGLVYLLPIIGILLKHNINSLQYYVISGYKYISRNTQIRSKRNYKAEDHDIVLLLLQHLLIFRSRKYVRKLKCKLYKRFIRIRFGVRIAEEEKVNNKY